MHEIAAHWECDACSVEGMDFTDQPRCWNCDGPVTVTARPAVRRPAVELSAER